MLMGVAMLQYDPSMLKTKVSHSKGYAMGVGRSNERQEYILCRGHPGWMQSNSRWKIEWEVGISW